MPKISVIVPMYRVEAYICRCLDSILAQTFTDFELILVDDGSPDRCGTIGDEYAQNDSRIRVLHKENGGVSSARNAGLAVAKGEYITFCDSDDYLVVDWLEELYGAAIKHSADVVVAGYTVIDANGEIKRSSQQESGVWQFSAMTEKLEYLLTDVLQKNAKNHGWEVTRRLYKTSIINENCIRFCTTCGNYAEDQAFTLECGLYASCVVGIENYGYRYVMRCDSMMNTTAMNMKLNEANEASVYFGNRFFACVRDKALQKQYALIHYLMMYQEYQKVVFTEKFKGLKNEIETIDNQKWYCKHTRNIAKCKTELEKRYGKRDAYRIRLLSRYCLHKSWKRYSLESAIVYNLLLR